MVLFAMYRVWDYIILSLVMFPEVGQSVTIVQRLPGGQYKFVCLIFGHYLG